jgi:hypothetical protein
MEQQQDGTWRTWAEQVGTGGGRVPTCSAHVCHATTDQIQHAVMSAGSQHLSIYEVDDLLIRPFFDLEYPRACNPHRVQHHDDALITEIISCTNSILRQDAGCAVQDVIMLDSSNAVKYSAHLIMHLEQRHALTSIHDAGVLAKKVTAQLAPDLCQVHGAEKIQTVIDTSADPCRCVHA